jgi:hypothetical protein
VAPTVPGLDPAAPAAVVLHGRGGGAAMANATAAGSVGGSGIAGRTGAWDAAMGSGSAGAGAS